LRRRGDAARSRHPGSIARVQIDGLIRSDNGRVEALEQLEKSRAAAVVVHINSPGGTTAGSEQLYAALMRLKAKKPLVGGGRGAGGIGRLHHGDCGRSHRRPTKLAGRLDRRPVPVSEFTELMKTVGVKVEEVKSSPLKAAPNGFEPTSPEARAALDALVRIPMPGSADSSKSGAAWTMRCSKKSRTGGFLPAARRSISSWSINSAMRKPPWLAGGAERRQERSAGARLQAVATLRRPDFSANGGFDYASMRSV
jgi:hypothetical protein